MLVNKGTSVSIPNTSLKNADHYANISTKGLRELMVDEEHSPKTLLYPRNTSLNPLYDWSARG